ncbi:MAG: hypothetical protein AAF409_19540, partial [Pseudomonadota bacterium]
MASLDSLNILTNGDFSNGLTGWNVENPSGGLPPGVVGGTVAFNRGAETVFGDSIDQDIVTTVGNTYAVTLDLIENNGGVADHTFQIDILDDNGTVIETVTETVENNSTNLVGFTFVATSTASNIRITNTNAPASFSSDGKVDNVRVIDVTGDDVLEGTNAAEAILGGPGDDTIAGGAGQDVLYGGDGDDTFIHGNGEELDNIFGGSFAALNTVDLSAELTNGVEANLNFLSGTMTGLGGTVAIRFINNFLGTQADDTITGLGTVTLDGQGGDDVLIGDLFTQSLVGGSGNDTFVQGAGIDSNDNIDGGTGIDTLDLSAEVNRANLVNLGAGTFTGDGGSKVLLNVENVIGSQLGDTITGSSDDNTLDGGDGNDTLNGGAGDDSLIGGAGNDIFTVADDGSTNRVDGGIEFLYGGEDNTLDVSNFTSALIFGGTGSTNPPTLVSENGTEIIFEDVGFLIGTDFDDRVLAEGVFNISLGDGNDTLKVNDRNIEQEFDGGDGIDLLDFSGSQSRVLLNLATGEIDVAREVRNFENVIGSNENDDIFGTDGANTIEGRGGSDLIITGDGDDVIFGGAGFDLIDPGNGNDVVYGGDGGAEIDAFGATGNKLFVGGASSDALYSGEGDDTIFGGGDFDFLEGRGGNDTLFGGDAGDFIGGGDGDDSLFGGDDRDDLFGDDGNDFIYGGAGRDELFGGDGNDIFQVADDGSTNSVDGGLEAIYGGEDNTLDVSNFTSGIVFQAPLLVSDPNLVVSGNGTIILVEEVGFLIGTDFDDDVQAFRFFDIETGDGNDTVKIAGFADRQRFDGGDGVDTLEFTGSIGLDLNLETGALNGTGGAFNFENVIGTGRDDTITGSDGVNSLSGQGGDDILAGGLGADALYGGDGTDTADFSGSG